MHKNTFFSLARRVATLVLASTALSVAATAQQRPLADWLSRQGQGYGTLLGFPADYLAFTGRTAGNPTASVTTLAVVDFAGIDAAAVQTASAGAVVIPTQTAGGVSERVLQNGRTEVRVHVHVTNALSYAIDLNSGNVSFGANPADVALGATPALAEASLSVVYIVDRAPGTAMEDLMAVIFFGAGDLTFVSFQSLASGALPSGGPAAMKVAQTAPVAAALRNGFRGGLADAFPVELIKIIPL